MTASFTYFSNECQENFNIPQGQEELLQIISQRTAGERTAVFPLEKATNNGTGQRLEESLPYPLSRVSLSLSITQLPLPQQIGLSAENWTQLHVSAGCPGRRGLRWSSYWSSIWSLAGLINPSLLRAGLTELVLACEQKEQCRGTGPCAAPFYHSMRASPILAHLHIGRQSSPGTA